jgi:urease accessory protein
MTPESAEQSVCRFENHNSKGAVGKEAHSHSHSHSHEHNEHGHTHEVLEHPGKFNEREIPNYTGRDFSERAFTIGIGGYGGKVLP